jgi:hypothetical protein
MHPVDGDKFTSDLLMYSSVIMLAIFMVGLVWRAKVKKTTMEHYFAHFVMGNFLMLIIIMNIASFITEANIATLVHPADEQPISMIARFLQHNVISVVGFLCACVTPFFLMMTVQGLQFFGPLRNEKGDVIRSAKPAAFFLLLIMSVVLVFSTFYIAWGNCALIAKGFKQVPEFNYAVERFFMFWKSPAEIAAPYRGRFDPNVEVSNYLGFNMNNSFFLFKVHIITSILEGVMIAILAVVMGESTIIDKLNQSLIDKDKADRKAKKEEEKGNPKPADPAKPVTPPTDDNRLPEEKKAAEKEDKIIRRLLKNAAKLTDSQVDEFEEVIRKKQTAMGPTGGMPFITMLNSTNKMLDEAEKNPNLGERKGLVEQVNKIFRSTCSDPSVLGIELPKN